MVPTLPPAASAATAYTVRARALGDGTAEATVGSERIVFDAAWAGDATELPGPAHLLASAFAACLLKGVERSAQLLPFRYTAAEVEVTAHRRDSPPAFTRIEYELRLVTDEPERRLRLLHENLRHFGTVYNTLAAACEISGTLVYDAGAVSDSTPTR
jgi:uncharacterized OsmC-like protein